MAALVPGHVPVAVAGRGNSGVEGVTGYGARSHPKYVDFASFREVRFWARKGTVGWETKHVEVCVSTSEGGGSSVPFS